MKFSILIQIILSINSRQNEYELSRAQKLWSGGHRAVHFEDHLLLLNEKMDKIKGIMTTYSPIVGGEDWTMTVTISPIGSMNNQKDGFLMAFSPYHKDIYTMNNRYYPK